MTSLSQEILATAVFAARGHRYGLAATSLGVRQVRWLRAGDSWPTRGRCSSLTRALRALEMYFAEGRLRGPAPTLDLSGIPPFRRHVMETLSREVPPGHVVTYGELALLAGRPGAARAVGTTMSRNPLPIFIPCHRVVASSGPGGYGPGLRQKKELLALEGFDLAI